MSTFGVRREKATLSLWVQSHPAIVPAESNWSNDGGNWAAVLTIQAGAG